MAGRGGPMTAEEIVAHARAMLPHRPAPAEALRAQARGALLVDIRGDDQRRHGLIPGAIVVPRNSLEWRCDPASEWRHPAITSRTSTSSLSATRGTNPRSEGVGGTRQRIPSNGPVPARHRGGLRVLNASGPPVGSADSSGRPCRVTLAGTWRLLAVYSGVRPG
jgi:hypothetical protein